MSLTDKIFELKNEYEQMIVDSKGGWPDVMCFADLNRVRGLLSSYSLDLAKEAAKYNRDFVSLYAQRKVNYFLEKTRLMNVGFTEDKILIKSASAAEPYAEIYVKELRAKEAVNEGLKTTATLILKQVNELLKSINQDIAILRKEFESIHERS